ncbi:Cytokinin-activating enzyme working in the direct activation pathway [Orobanche minor]
MEGGYSTLNEIFNITSWAEQDYHTKPIGLLNINNFFSDLLAFLDQGVDRKFISQPSRDIIICADTIADLLMKFQTYISVKNLEVKAHQPPYRRQMQKKFRSFRSFTINPDVRSGRATEFILSRRTHLLWVSYVFSFPRFILSSVYCLSASFNIFTSTTWVSSRAIIRSSFAFMQIYYFHEYVTYISR